MTGGNFIEWAIVVALFGVMSLCAYGLGDYVAQTVVRLRTRSKAASYEKWGVTSDLYKNQPLIWFISGSVFFVTASALTFLLAFVSTVLITAETTTVGSRLYFTGLIAFYVLYFGCLIEVGRVRKITDKVQALDNLKAAFHQRFAVTELLSMYETLRQAPDLFWEEYTQLPDEAVREETNREYRVRAEPYRNAQSRQENRLAITIATLTLIAAITVPVAIELVQ